MLGVNIAVDINQYLPYLQASADGAMVYFM